MSRAGRASRWLTAFTVAIYAFLFAPIVVLIVFSFNQSRRNFVWQGFTLDWYPRLFANDDLIDALSGHAAGRGHRGRRLDDPRRAAGAGAGPAAVPRLAARPRPCSSCRW